MSKTTELKPCPFCGELPIGDYIESDRANCQNCCCSGPAEGRNPQRITWNSRPIEDALKAEIEELKAKVVLEQKEALAWERNHNIMLRAMNKKVDRLTAYNINYKKEIARLRENQIAGRCEDCKWWKTMDCGRQHVNVGETLTYCSAFTPREKGGES